MGNRHWLITGVSGGIGRALAQAALQAGDYVTGTLRQEAQCAEFVALAPDRAQAVLLDVTDEARVKSALPPICAARPVDILVNNAGHSIFGPMEDTPLTAVRSVMETNLFGAIAVTQAILPQMRASRSGHIINISSGCGLSGVPGLAAYCASKFALEGMSETLAAELTAFGIKVTLIEPGAVATKLISHGTAETGTVSTDYQSQFFGQGKQVLDAFYGDHASAPERVAAAVLRIAGAADAPLRLLTGADMVTTQRDNLQRRLAELEAWSSVSAEG